MYFLYERPVCEDLRRRRKAASGDDHLDQKEVTLFRKQKIQLSALISPESSDTVIRWSSKNEKVARVNSKGKVTAAGRGTARIIAETDNGLRAVCRVHVLELPGSITLDKTSLTLFKGKTAVLSAKILPKEAAAAEVQWVSRDEKVAKVSASGKVTAVNYGTTKIIAKTLNGKKAVCQVRVTAPPQKITLNRTSVSLVQGNSVNLRASVTPQKAAGASIKWASSNTKVAEVDASGKVTARAQGTAVIVAAAENGVKAACIVKSVMQYKISGKTLTISSAEGTKTYYAYSQRAYGYGWYRSHGCVTTAVAIVASSYGKSYTPKDIHEGPVSAVYSERYAVTKMGEAAELLKSYGKTAISVRTASAILKNMGIENKAVYSYDRAEALKEIREHLKTGKPVIIKANNNVYNGRQLGNPHHAIVVVGVDGTDHAICISPGSSTFMTSYTLSTLLYHHMTPASGNYMTPYMTDLQTAGGYILIG